MGDWLNLLQSNYMIKDKLKKLVDEAILEAFEVKEETQIERPKDHKNGDYSTNIAIILSKKLNKNPQEIAETIKNSISNPTFLEKIEIAGPGFINFWISPIFLQEEILKIVETGEKYGSSSLGQGKKARVEYVSANPTGPLHFGNGRGGPIGDTVVNVLSFSGFEVLREYIDNDSGNQVLELGKTLASKAGLIKTEEELTYKGSYTDELALIVKEKIGDTKGISDAQIIEKSGKLGVEVMFSEIIKDCEKMGIKFDYIVHESELQKKAEEAISELNKKGLIKKYEGATWFAPNSEYLKDKDAVVVKSDGSYTYFTADVVYHKEKFTSGYDLVIDVFGSNTSGHVPKLKALAEVYGFDVSKFKVILYQFVRIKRGEEILRMSKREGNFITVEEVLEEVGKDALRYFLLSQRPETHMDFDIELAKKKANENPVYYIQYAHARMNQILEKAGNIETEKKDVSLLKEKEELALIKHLLSFPELIEDIAQSLEVNKLATFSFELATFFHKFYEAQRVISEDKNLSSARLLLVRTSKIVLSNSLSLMGISAPSKM